MMTRTASAARAAGSLKGVAVSEVARHYAGHHSVLGTGAGCVIGHHEAAKHARERPSNRARAAKARPAQLGALTLASR